VRINFVYKQREIYQWKGKDLLYLFNWVFSYPEFYSQIIISQPGTKNGIKLKTSFAEMQSFLIAWNFSYL